MLCRKIFTVAMLVGAGFASGPALAVPSCDEQLKTQLEAGRKAVREQTNYNQQPPDTQKQIDELLDKGIRDNFKCQTSEAPAAGQKTNQQSAQQEKPKEEKRRGICGPNVPMPPEPTARTTEGMAAKAPDFYTSCSAEKAYMRYELDVLCFNGPLTHEVESEVARMDASTARDKLNAILERRLWNKDDYNPESLAISAWHACLLRTRLRQLGEQ